MRVAYCDCFSGISGDMFLAALLDAGLPLDHLRESLSKLGLSEAYELGQKKVMKGAIQATLLEVVISPEAQVQGHGRHLSDITALIEKSGLPDKVQALSIDIFCRLAEAEAGVHGSSVEEIHFHEVGAVDSILDIVGAAIGLEHLGIERLYASPLPLGSGKVETQHGTLPLPAPATLELLRAARAPVVPSPAQQELVTPTGAAILAALATFEQPAMTITGLGCGGGQRELPWPNILRLVLGETGQAQSQPLIVIETNIDDMNPQVFGHVMERLFAAGALDVYFTPVYMKKNRPATMISVMARRAQEAELARILLEETTTLGVRVQPFYRYEAERGVQRVVTEYGEIPLKVKYQGGQIIQAAAEYEACAKLALEKKEPLLKIFGAAQSAARRLMDEGEK